MKLLILAYILFAASSGVSILMFLIQTFGRAAQLIGG